MNAQWIEFDELLPPHDCHVAFLTDSGVYVGRLREVSNDGEVLMLATDNREWRHTLVAWTFLPDGFAVEKTGLAGKEAYRQDLRERLTGVTDVLKGES